MSRNAAGGGTIENVRIAVDHAGTLGGPLRIWLVPSFGERRLAGTTRGVGVDTLTVASPVATGVFRLVAEPITGAAAVSREFSLSVRDVGVVEWNLATNTVFVRPGYTPEWPEPDVPPRVWRRE